MKSQIFYTNQYKKIEEDIKSFLNKGPDFLSRATISSTRATGDAIEHILGDYFQDILGDLAKHYSASFARRAMADLTFEDQHGLYYVVDVKTHRLETKFNMPNLTSVERLTRFYEEDKNYYVILMVAYNVTSQAHIRVKRVNFVPIEFLDWDCLTIGALGWGQIQIANANVIKIKQKYSRRKWMLELCDILSDYYPREIEKTNERLEYFKEVKKKWLKKDDIWE